jgi:hypothetical protein
MFPSCILITVTNIQPVSFHIHSPASQVPNHFKAIILKPEIVSFYLLKTQDKDFLRTNEQYQQSATAILLLYILKTQFCSKTN